MVRIEKYMTVLTHTSAMRIQRGILISHKLNTASMSNSIK